MSPFRTITATIIILFTWFFLFILNSTKDVQLKKPFSTFPKKIAMWTGKEKFFNEDIYKMLGVDNSFLSIYSTSDGKQIQVYIGYYQNQYEGNLIHSPKHCLPGSGWNILSISSECLINHNNNSENITATKLIVEKLGKHQVVLYWFQSRGRFIASEYMQKIYLVIDSILHRRTDGSFIRLIAPMTIDNEEKTTKYLKDFANILIPILHEYIPS